MLPYYMEGMGALSILKTYNFNLKTICLKTTDFLH